MPSLHPNVGTRFFGMYAAVSGAEITTFPLNPNAPVSLASFSCISCFRTFVNYLLKFSPPPEILKLEQVAAYLQVSERKAWELVKQDLLPHRQI